MALLDMRGASDKEKHPSFRIKTTGLHVNPINPYFGASPDGLVTCTCCGDGLVEIKCLYILRHTTHKSATNLKHTPDGPKLSMSHTCYYQILEMCDCSYCDFVCWTLECVHIEWIYRKLISFYR